MNLDHGGNVFAIAESRGWDWREVLDFSASINPLGPSPKVRTAIDGAIDRIVHYPTRDSSSLVRALSRHWDIDADRILAGNGATELIHFVARQWHGRSVALHVPTFSEFHRAFPAASHQPANHDIVIATNPNNPVGDAFEQNANFIDESFLDFTDLPTAMHDDTKWVLRSLTKFQALPGLRVGVLIGPKREMAELRGVREPWQVNVLAETAAIAAIEDRDHASRTCQFVRAESEYLYNALKQLAGIHPVKPEANYVYATLSYPAASLYEHLLKHRILVRVCTGAPGIDGEAVRIAVKTREANDRLIAAWSEVKCGDR